MQHEERDVTESECAENRKNPVWSLGHLGPRAVTWRKKTQPSQQEAVFSVIFGWFSHRMNKSEWQLGGYAIKSGFYFNLTTLFIIGSHMTHFWFPRKRSKREKASYEEKEKHTVYHNFQTFTRMADYPQWSIFVVRGKNVQQITRTGLLPAPQNQRKSWYCIIGIRTHKLGVMNLPWIWIPLKLRKHFSG